MKCTCFLLFQWVVYDDFIVHLTFGDDKFRPYLIPPNSLLWQTSQIYFVHVGNKALCWSFRCFCWLFCSPQRWGYWQNILFRTESVCKLHSGVSWCVNFLYVNFLSCIGKMEVLGANDDPQNRDIRKSLSDLVRKPGLFVWCVKSLLTTSCKGFSWSSLLQNY